MDSRDHSSMFAYGCVHENDAGVRKELLRLELLAQVEDEIEKVGRLRQVKYL